MPRLIRPIFASLAQLDAYLASLTSGVAPVYPLYAPGRDGDDSARIAARSTIAGVQEYLVPVPRADGGHGVIASVDSATQVTLAAGHCLGSGGAVERWDKSASSKLGVVEFSRSALVVTLPTTAGLAATDVLYDPSLDFSSWTSGVAFETAVGLNFPLAWRLVNKTTGLRILRRVVSGGAWISLGNPDFARVSLQKWGSIASVDSGTAATLTAGHSLPASCTLYVWDTSGAVALAAAAVATVVGNTLTVAAGLPAGLAATDQVWVDDTELTVGTGRSIVPDAGALVRFVATGLSLTGAAVQAFGGIYRPCRLAADVASYTALSAADKRLMAGWKLSAAAWKIGGAARHADASTRAMADTDGALGATTAALTSPVTRVGLSATAGSSTVTRNYVICRSSSTSTVPNDITDATYATALPYLRADDGAVFSGMSL
jgi:hypothetical protein